MTLGGVENTFRTVVIAFNRTGTAEVVLTTMGSAWDSSSFQGILYHHT